MSAPNSIGRCSNGVAKTLSTTTWAPAAWARSQTARRSTSSCIGFDGDSKKTAVVGSASAARHWSRSEPSTKTLSTPQRGRISSRITKHEPNRLRGRHDPVALTEQAGEGGEDRGHPESRSRSRLGAPSISRNRCSKVVTVGLP